MSRLRTIIDGLNALGSSDAIAESMAAKGVTGIPEDPEACAVAFYLETQGFRYPSVTPASVAAYEDENVVGINLCRGGVPSPLSRFIESFDNGDYPSLVHREDRV